jgi:prepilin peptidase CpaA
LGAAIVGHFVYGWAAASLKVGMYQATFAVSGAFFCSLAPGILFYKGGMGGGDLKLFAAVGALCHPMLGIEAQLYSMLIAAIVAPARLAYEGKLLSVFRGSLALLFNPLRTKEKRAQAPSEMLTWFRLGPAIFLGTLTTVTANLFPLLVGG